MNAFTQNQFAYCEVSIPIVMHTSSNDFPYVQCSTVSDLSNDVKVQCSFDSQFSNATYACVWASRTSR